MPTLLALVQMLNVEGRYTGNNLYLTSKLIINYNKLFIFNNISIYIDYINNIEIIILVKLVVNQVTNV